MVTNIPLEQQVQQKLIQIYVSQVPMVILSYFFSVCLMFYVLRECEQNSGLLLWFGLNIIISIVSYLMSRLYHAKPTLFSYQQWLIFFVVESLLAGILWGSASTLFIHPAHLLDLTLITILTLGVLSGALYGMSLLPPTYFFFLTPTILQFIFAVAPESSLNILVVAATALGMMLAWLSYQLYKVNYETFFIRFQNERLSASLETEKEQIEQASHAKTQFLAAASHDLRQPLQAQRLFVEAIREKTDQADLKELSNYAIESQVSMQTMLDTLLEISRLDAGTVQPQFVVISLKDFFWSLSREFATSIENKGLHLTVHWPPSSAFIFSDRALLESILRNLLSNALRYTEQGHIMLAARQRGNHWRIEVRDSGIGIPTDKHQFIFEEFHQIDNPQRDQAKGLGLGLSIVHRLCKLMYYELDFRSCPNHGSTFAIHIPILDEPQEQPISNLTQELNLTNLQGVHVLVVDDDMAIRVGLKQSLSLYGLHITAAANIQSALSSAQTRKPDVVITDYRLAGSETGIQLIEQLQASINKALPAIILTGNTAPNQLQTLKSIHCAVLHKPVDVQLLLKSIQNVLELDNLQNT